MGIIEKIAEYTRLCREYSELPLNAKSVKAYEPIAKRKAELKRRIEALRKEIGMDDEKAADHNRGVYGAAGNKLPCIYRAYTRWPPGVSFAIGPLDDEKGTARDV